MGLVLTKREATKEKNMPDLPTIDLGRSCRIAAENLARDSSHIPMIQKVIEDAFEQARKENETLKSK
jgi:hypothetical protein